MSLPLLPHTESFGTDFLLYYASISLVTVVRAAEYSFKWKKSKGIFKVLSWKRQFDYCNAKTFFMQVQCFLTPFPDLTLRHLNLWKREPLSLAQIVNRVFPSHPPGLLPGWHNSMTALLQDVYGQLLISVIALSFPRFAQQCNESDWANWFLLLFDSLFFLATLVHDPVHHLAVQRIVGWGRVGHE